MKARIEHRVPLTGRAMKILDRARELNGSDGLIFPAKRSGKALSNMAFSMLLRRLELPCVMHGFRAGFRMWTMETTATPWAVCERALAHRLGGSQVESYARADLLEQRRELMQRWCDYIFGD